MNEDMLKELLANKAAMDAMPQATRDALQAQYDALVKERESVSEYERIAQEEARKEAERRKKQEEELFRDLKGLNVGAWTQNVPRNRRFALCHRVGKRFVERVYSNRDDPRNWEDETQYCAIDLIRGYMAPYWGYYGASYERQKYVLFYKNSIAPLVESADEDSYLRKVRSEYNFFKCDGHYDGIKFHVCTYKVDEDGGITVTGMSEEKTWREHRDDLKAEFGA